MMSCLRHHILSSKATSYFLELNLLQVKGYVLRLIGSSTDFHVCFVSAMRAACKMVMPQCCCNLEGMKQPKELAQHKYRWTYLNDPSFRHLSSTVNYSCDTQWYDAR